LAAIGSTLPVALIETGALHFGQRTFLPKYLSAIRPVAWHCGQLKEMDTALAPCAKASAIRGDTRAAWVPSSAILELLSLGVLN
jgi:hypothetical protein